MKFSELKKASQNYLNDKDTDLNSDEIASKDNSFVSSIKKLTRTINADCGELVLKSKDHQAGTEQAIKHLEIACTKWSIEFNKIRQSNMTPEQVARLKK
jgi:chemotaxis regulatin CheY-phosphate phosphatase CheZ